MVNTLLVVVCGLSLVVWLVQEQVAGRPAEQEPGWSRLAYRLVLAAWLIWLAAAVWIKDGDFAFVLVMLTLLAGVIVLLDRLWFARRRAGRREEGARAEPREIAEHARSFFPVLLVVLVLRRSEEHTSELQSRGHLVCRRLLATKREAGRRAD